MKISAPALICMPAIFMMSSCGSQRISNVDEAYYIGFGDKCKMQIDESGRAVLCLAKKRRDPAAAHNAV
jgi:hypothetical protein